ncbi:hypothetical protein CBP51_15630 [Cellvibrio mixtus]|uniref:Uncharacterized protein n=1 Tax=Cellvibrio mixtus TaxID=39650 RepID=A0A266Q404_9GAMM|nr:hypothetical protein CBP51_15630 [Cellvibrio mixtus]
MKTRTTLMIQMMSWMKMMKMPLEVFYRYRCRYILQEYIPRKGGYKCDWLTDFHKTLLIKNLYARDLIFTLQTRLIPQIDLSDVEQNKYLYN